MRKLFENDKAIIGVVHLLALPASPRFKGEEELRRRALSDALALYHGGVDALLFENYGDVPFSPGRVESHVVAYMSSIAEEVKREVPLPFGVNVLRNDALAALAVASATGGEFIRVNVHTGARLTWEGIIQGQAQETLRYRARLGSGVRIFADVAVKHSWPLASISLEEEILSNVERGLADAVILTGGATGEPPNVEELKRASRASSVPVIVGSGLSAENCSALLSFADAAIVGTSLKEGGKIENPVSEARVKALMQEVAKLR
ncbi:BtpA/SgcQ family protein [Candidatus Pyrohabitans sp.]